MGRNPDIQALIMCRKVEVFDLTRRVYRVTGTEQDEVSLSWLVKDREVVEVLDTTPAGRRFLIRTLQGEEENFYEASIQVNARRPTQGPFDAWETVGGAP